MNDVAVLLLRLLPDVFLQLLDPGFTFFPAKVSVYVGRTECLAGLYVLGGVEHVVQDDAAAGHVDIDRERLGFRLGLNDLSLSLTTGGFISSRKLPHQRVPAVVVEIDAGHVRVVQSTRAATLLGLAPPSPIEVGGRRTATAGTREGGSLELLLLVVALESLQQVGS